MNIEKLPDNELLNCFLYLNGVSICSVRNVSIKIKKLIDCNESFIYSIYMSSEYKNEFKFYKNAFPIREDWKNLYIICDQYHIAKNRADKYRKIIQYRMDVVTADKVLSIIESVISSINIFLNICNVSIFGFSASRSLIKEFMKNNPGYSLPDAMKALGMTVPPSLSSPSLHNDITFY